MKVYKYMTTKESNIENFSLEMVEGLAQVLKKPESLDEIKPILTVQSQKDLILSKCLTSILSISGKKKNLKLKSPATSDFTCQLRQFNYFGAKPNYEFTKDVKLDLQLLP